MYPALADSVSHLNGLLSSVIASLKRDPIILFIGFSMGGSMALHLAFDRLRGGLPTHGVVVLSSFVGRDSAAIPIIRQHCSNHNRIAVPQVKMIHGTADDMVSVY